MPRRTTSTPPSSRSWPRTGSHSPRASRSLEPNSGFRMSPAWAANRARRASATPAARAEAARVAPRAHPRVGAPAVLPAAAADNRARRQRLKERTTENRQSSPSCFVGRWDFTSALEPTPPQADTPPGQFGVRRLPWLAECNPRAKPAAESDRDRRQFARFDKPLLLQV